MPWFYYSDTHRFWFPGKGGGTISSLMMNVFFAAGWTLCIGKTLGVNPMAAGMLAPWGILLSPAVEEQF